MKKEKLKQIALDFLKEKGVKPIYICISGAHLYGFPSVDSDYDIRCSHVIDTKDLFHLKKRRETLEKTMVVDGVEIDIVSQEVEKMLGLLVKNNSNILEQIFAENLFTTIEHKSLLKLAKAAISKQVYHPYQGMAKQNYKKFIESLNPVYKKKSVKKYLYVMRSYMAGIFALKTGKIQPNILELNKHFKLSVVDKLVKLKKEKEVKEVQSIEPAETAIARLAVQIEEANKESKLPDKPQNIDDIDKFLYKVRLKYI
jgi:predicted nucleotidyltransferase